METDRGNFYFMLFDNNTRNQDLELVHKAKDGQDLLAATKSHFNERVETLTAERILAEFTDNSINQRLARTPGFDPELFKAVMLFELSHLSEDESIIPEIVQALRHVWTEAGGWNDEELAMIFTAETKRARPILFSVYSELLLGKGARLLTQSMSLENPPEDKDPLQEDIDGRDWRVIVGGGEVKRVFHPVLTRQLYKDLLKLFPAPVIRELEFRFPDDGRFDDIYPFIQKIMQERKEGTIPPAEELARHSRRYKLRLHDMLPVKGDDDEVDPKNAVEDFIESHRSLDARGQIDEVYIPKMGRWFSIQVVESETEAATYYRRVYHGDLSADENVELSAAERTPEIIQHLEEPWHPDNPSDVRPHIIDLYGSWDMPNNDSVQ